MPLTTSSQAAAVGSSVINEQIKPTAENLPRKILIGGQYDPAKTATIDNVPVLVTSPEDVGARFGFGFEAHRLAVQSFTGSSGTQTWVSPMPEDGSAVQADGKVAFTGSTGVLAGTVEMAIAGIPVPFSVATNATDIEIAAACVAAVQNFSGDVLPITAAVGTTTSEAEFDSKSGGTWGNDISIKFNLKVGQETPTGVAIVITAMANGTTLPVMQDVLDGLGTDDDANEIHFTGFSHAALEDVTSLDAIANYVGQGNTLLGLWSKTVSRPFRALTGNVVAGSSGLTNLIALSDTRKLDRANGIVAVPGSASHPAEIAAQALGHMERINDNRAAEHYVGILLIGIDPGAKADRWTKDFDDRDTAVKSGIGITKIESSNVILQNLVTFYRPDSVPVTSNGYRDMVNISKLQNILDSQRVLFEQDKWLGNALVASVTKVSSNDRLKTKDIDAVKDALVTLVKSWENRAWIFSASHTIEQLQNPGSVVIRTSGNGFDINLSIILSGVASIIDVRTEFDISIAIFL